MMAQQEAPVIAIEKSHMGEHELEKDFGPRLWWQLGYIERGRGVYTSLPALSVRYATERLHSIGFDSPRQAACTHLFLFIHEPASRAFVLGMEGGFRFGSSFSACLHNQVCRFGLECPDQSCCSGGGPTGLTMRSSNCSLVFSRGCPSPMLMYWRRGGWPT